MYSGEHERSIWPGDDREPAASSVLPGRSRALPVSGNSGKHVGPVPKMASILPQNVQECVVCRRRGF